MADGKKEYVFIWLIENYSYCWHDNGEKLVSPNFTLDSLESTSWNLQLYPRGAQKGRENEIALFLARSENDAGPQTLTLKYELSVIAANENPFKTLKSENAFTKGDTRVIFNFLYVDEVLLRRRPELIPQDCLKLQCKIWYGDGRKLLRAGQYTARTRIGIEKISFVHKVEKFSALGPNEKEVIQVASQSKPECIISSSLYFTGNSCCEDKLIVEISSNERSYRLHGLRIFLLKGPTSRIFCGEIHNLFDASKTYVRKLALSLTRQGILDGGIEFLPKDELSLRYECTFSTGVEFQKMEDARHKLPISASKKGCKIVGKNGVYNTEERLSVCTTVSEDLKSLYANQCLTDVVLKTKTKTFPANKLVLGARSSVFKAMLNEDVKEKNTDCIHVDDLENETVEQLLLFLYSDKLEGLEWESAIKLYCVSNKYAIEKLKVLCSSFLVDNLNIRTACELLLLVDTHNDSDLKHFAEDFILKHKEQIFESEEWQNLEETNPQFVKRTINLMIKGKKGGK